MNYVGKEETVQERQQVENKKSTKEDAAIKTQRILLAYIIDRDNWFKKVAQVISPEDFIDPFYHDVAVRFWEQMESGKGNPAQIMDSYSDEEEHKKVAELFVSPIRANLSLAEQERAINDAVIKIKKSSLDYRASKATDIQDLQNIIKEQNQLQKIHVTLD